MERAPAASARPAALRAAARRAALWADDGPPPGGFPPSGGQSAPQQSSGLAIAALVLGIVALLLCWVPIVNNFAAILAVVGLALGIPALISGQRGRRAGLGLAVASVILSGVAFVGVLATQAFYSSVMDDVAKDISNAADIRPRPPTVRKTPRRRRVGAALAGRSAARPARQARRVHGDRRLGHAQRQRRRCRGESLQRPSGRPNTCWSRSRSPTPERGKGTRGWTSPPSSSAPTPGSTTPAVAR